MSTAAYYRAGISVRLESPFLVQGLAARAFGIDAAQMRDHLDRPIIPASEIKGVVRHALALFAEADRVTALCGTEDVDDPRPGRPIFSDLVCEESWQQVDRRVPRTTRVSIDRQTGAAREGHLQVVELLAPLGQEVTFSGEVLFIAGTDAEAKEIVDDLRDALGLVHAIGAFKTAGFGRVAERKVGEPRRRSPLLPDKTATETEFVLEFTLDRPLLADTARLSDNVMKGSPVIPGSAIKGALAARLEAAGALQPGNALSTALTELTIGHAFPHLVRDGGAEVAVEPVRPLSLLAIEGRPGWLDAAIEEEWLEALANPMPAAFCTDWKPTDYPETVFAETVTRTRVEIDPSTGANRRGRLFSQIAVSPTIEGHPLRWRATVTWPEAPSGEMSEALVLLSGALRDGLAGIGKTRAIMQDVKTQPVEKSAPAIGSQTRFVRIMLRTPLLMLDANDLADERALARAVSSYWIRHGGGALDLAGSPDEPWFFAEQELHGGWAMVHRHAFGTGVVKPFVCMKPGTVFVLEVRDREEAARKLAEWSHRGLPALDGVSWETCPFVPENGYGAIEVDPPRPSPKPQAGAHQ